MICAVLIAAGGTGTSVHAAGIPADSPATSAPSRDRAAENARLLRVAGRVEQVTPTGLSLRSADGSAMEFGLSDQTVVLDGQVAKNVSDLRVGDQVEVRYFAQGIGRNVAQTVTRQPGAGG